MKLSEIIKSVEECENNEFINHNYGDLKIFKSSASKCITIEQADTIIHIPLEGYDPYREYISWQEAFAA